MPVVEEVAPVIKAKQKKIKEKKEKKEKKTDGPSVKFTEAFMEKIKDWFEDENE
jgi:hypothetical protein